MSGEWPGHDVPASFSRSNTPCFMTSASGRPVTFSMTSPSSTVLVFEYWYCAPGARDGGIFNATARSWLGVKTVFGLAK